MPKAKLAALKKLAQRRKKSVNTEPGKGFDPKLHPRYPKGHPLGGQFAPKRLSIPEDLSELNLDGLALVLDDDVFKGLSVTPAVPPRKTTDFAKVHRSKFDQSPKEIQSLINSLDEPEAAPKRPDSNSSYCNAEGIYLRPTASSDVYRHEYGHWVDRKLASEGDSYLSTSPEFMKAMQFDADRILSQTRKRREALVEIGQKSPKPLIEKVKKLNEARQRQASYEDVGYEAEKERALRFLAAKAKEYKNAEPVDIARVAIKKRGGLASQVFERLEARGMMNDEIAAEMVAHGNDPRVMMRMGAGAIGDPTMGIDLVGALTKNRVGWGHATSYYNRPGTQQTEAFANMFAMLSSGDPLAEEIVGSLAPNMLREFKKRLP